MALTEADKKRIEEEEKYRLKIREQSQTKKSSLLVWILFIAILGFFVVFAIYVTKHPYSAKPMETTISTPTGSVIGKYAFNKDNGVYIGKITKVKSCNTVKQIICYVVEREGSSRPLEVPVDNTDVRGTQ